MFIKISGYFNGGFLRILYMNIYREYMTSA